jgi:hypothetical protein
MTKANYNPLLADMEAFLKGAEQSEGGRVALSVDMVAFLNTPIVHKYSDKDGTEYTGSFRVRDLVLDKPRNDDDSESKVVQGHRREAALINLFGFESWNIPQRMRTALDRIIPEAIALQHYYKREDNTMSIQMVKVPGDLNKTSRRVLGGIPAGDMFELVDKEGALNTLGKKSLRLFPAIYRAHTKRDAPDDATLAEFMLAFKVEADGRASSLFDGAKALTSVQFLDRLVAAARAEGVLPPLATRNTSGKTDKGADLKGSASLCLSSIDHVLSADDSDVAFSQEVELMFDAIAERWAAYRSAFPRLPLD